MSTKTIYKRIALGVIAALVFAPFASVVPANAVADANSAFLHAGAANNVAANFATSVSVPVGTRATVDLTAGLISDAADVVNLTAVLTSSPAGATAIGAAGGATFTTVGTPLNTVATGNNAVRILTTAADGAVSTVQTLGYTPNVPGVYVITTVLAGVPVGDDVAGPVANGTLTHVLTINAGFSADATNANRAFPIQGTNITSGFTAVAGGQATVRITNLTASTQFFVTTNAGAIISGTPNNARAGALVNTNGTNLAGGFNFTTGGDVLAGDHFDVRVTDLGAATVTITVRSFAVATGVASAFVTATATFGAVSAASAQFSTSIIAAGAAVGGAADATNVRLASTLGGQAANIQVTVRDQNNNPLAAGVTATIAGPGLLGIVAGAATNTGATGRALTLATTAANGLANVTVVADGTAGVATITISSGTVILATETVTFFGAVATLTATQNLRVASASATGAQLGTSDGTGQAAAAITAALTPAVVIVARDANGNVVPGLTITGVSSAATIIAAATVVQAVGTAATTGAAGPGTYLASVTSAVGGVSGATATVTFRTPGATAGTFISAAPLTFTLGGGVSTETIAFDKSSYAPGEAMIITRTAKDAAGNPVFDGVASPAITFSKAVGGTVPGAGFYVGGVSASSASVATSGLFAPVSAGALTALATSSNTARTALTAAADVEDAGGAAATDAANEATDAANAATDAALAAAEAADAATSAAQEASDAVAALSESVTQLIAGLQAQIQALATVVNKIAKQTKK